MQDSKENTYMDENTPKVNELPPEPKPTIDDLLGAAKKYSKDIDPWDPKVGQTGYKYEFLSKRYDGTYVIRILQTGISHIEQATGMQTVTPIYAEGESTDDWADKKFYYHDDELERMHQANVYSEKWIEKKMEPLKHERTQHALRVLAAVGATVDVTVDDKEILNGVRVAEWAEVPSSKPDGAARWRARVLPESIPMLTHDMCRGGARVDWGSHPHAHDMHHYVDRVSKLESYQKEHPAAFAYPYAGAIGFDVGLFTDQSGDQLTLLKCAPYEDQTPDEFPVHVIDIAKKAKRDTLTVRVSFQATFGPGTYGNEDGDGQDCPARYETVELPDGMRPLTMSERDSSLTPEIVLAAYAEAMLRQAEQPLYIPADRDKLKKLLNDMQQAVKNLNVDTQRQCVTMQKPTLTLESDVAGAACLACEHELATRPEEKLLSFFNPTLSPARRRYLENGKILAKRIAWLRQEAASIPDSETRKEYSSVVDYEMNGRRAFPVFPPHAEFKYSYGPDGRHIIIHKVTGKEYKNIPEPALIDREQGRVEGRWDYEKGKIIFAFDKDMAIYEIPLRASEKPHWFENIEVSDTVLMLKPYEDKDSKYPQYGKSSSQYLALYSQGASEGQPVAFWCASQKKWIPFDTVASEGWAPAPANIKMHDAMRSLSVSKEYEGMRKKQGLGIDSVPSNPFSKMPSVEFKEYPETNTSSCRVNVKVNEEKVAEAAAQAEKQAQLETARKGREILAARALQETREQMERPARALSERMKLCLRQTIAHCQENNIMQAHSKSILLIAHHATNHDNRISTEPYLAADMLGQLLLQLGQVVYFMSPRPAWYEDTFKAGPDGVDYRHHPVESPAKSARPAEPTTLKPVEVPAAPVTAAPVIEKEKGESSAEMRRAFLTAMIPALRVLDSGAYTVDSASLLTTSLVDLFSRLRTAEVKPSDLSSLQAAKKTLDDIKLLPKSEGKLSSDRDMCDRLIARLDTVQTMFNELSKVGTAHLAESRALWSRFVSAQPEGIALDAKKVTETFAQMNTALESIDNLAGLDKKAKADALAACAEFISTHQTIPNEDDILGLMA